MDIDDEDIFCMSPLGRYAARPDDLQDMSLVFSVIYTMGGSDGPEEAADHIPDVLDGSDNNEIGEMNQTMKKLQTDCLRSSLAQQPGNYEKGHVPLVHKVPQGKERRWRPVQEPADKVADLKGNVPSFEEQKWKHQGHCSC